MTESQRLAEALKNFLTIRMVDRKVKSLEAVANQLEITKATLYSTIKTWDQNRRGDSVKSRHKIATWFGFQSWDKLIEAWKESESIPAGIDASSFVIDNTPEYDAAVAACKWIPINQVYSADTKKRAQIIDNGEFIVRIEGDCMEKRWPDTARVRFRIVRLDREGWPVGEDCIFISSEDDVTFKRLISIDEDALTIAPLNQKKYPGVTNFPRQMVSRVAVALRVENIPPKEALKIVKK